MPKTEQQLPEQEQPGNQAKASAQNLSEVPKTPEYNPEQLQRSFEIVNQESDHFKHECVMYQQAQAMGMTIEEYRRWYKLRSQRSKRFRRAPQLLDDIWHWTGFGEKKLWDILQLLIVPAVLAGGAFYLQETAKQEDQRLADERTKQESLNKYFDSMTALLLERKLRISKPNDEVRTIARAKTLTTLEELKVVSRAFELSDDVRKSLILQFLQENQLIRKDKVVVPLKGANFNGISFNDGDLSKVDLSEVRFWRANFVRVIFRESDFRKSILINANFSKANFSKANFSKAIIFETKFNNSDFHGADFTEADFVNADFSSSDLSGANFSKASFRDDFDRRGDDIATAQLKQAKLCNTTLPDGTVSNRDCKGAEPNK